MVAKASDSVSWTVLGVAVVLVVQSLISISVVEAAGAKPTQPLQGLVKRLLPQPYHNVFDFQVVPEIALPTPENKHDVFRVSNKDGSSSSTATGRILIEGTSLSALGAGLKYYLDQAGQVELTWSGNRFNELPATPPSVPDVELDSHVASVNGHVRGSFVPWRYYTNVVTFGYQLVFWDWKRWEREIDWMLLNGINLLPAMVGQEYVVRQFYRNLNLTDVEIDTFLTGPAYMPWQRMGNLQGSWNHKLTHTSAANELVYKNKWIDSQWELQQLILARLQEFDITPILPAFPGFVPRALVNKFPNAVFKNSSDWSQFPIAHTRVTYVEQTDPLFTDLTVQFLELQQSLNKGVQSHHYLLDLFNELEPACQTPACMKAITTSVTHALQKVHKDAVWVMQGWFLLKDTVWTPEATSAYFEGIRAANGTPFILDLASESLPVWTVTKGFYGYDFGWSVINNYGGAQGLFGKIPDLLTVPFQAFKQYPNMKGMGVTTETVNNNEYIYQLTLGLPWQSPQQTINGTEHLEQFIRRRYGAKKATPLAQDAWNKLSKTVWDCRSGQASQSKSIIEKLPDLNMTEIDKGWLGTVFWYNKTTVVQAWNQLVQSALQEHHGQVPASFKFDLVDTTREILLATVLPALHESLVDGYKAHDVSKVKAYGRQIVALIRDADKVLSTSPFFSFSAWIRDAKESIDPIRGSSQVTFSAATGGASPTKAGYQQFLESNARDLVTWWGPEGTGPPGSLQDYASKQWGGLLTSYYLPRWTLFIKQLEQAAAAKRPWTRTSDNFANLTLARETEWQAEIWGQRGGESLEKTNGQESVEVVREIWAKWRDLAVRVAAGSKA
ncbi:hypothetical protein BGZ75_004617 [Mortierella antarctica]|nr:hypothetical protein BGZ75_004617 [Mortierella antarctica]